MLSKALSSLKSETLTEVKTDVLGSSSDPLSFLLKLLCMLDPWPGMRFCAWQKVGYHHPVVIHYTAKKKAALTQYVFCGNNFGSHLVLLRNSTITCVLKCTCWAPGTEWRSKFVRIKQKFMRQLSIHYQEEEEPLCACASCSSTSGTSHRVEMKKSNEKWIKDISLNKQSWRLTWSAALGFFPQPTRGWNRNYHSTQPFVSCQTMYWFKR